MSFRYSGVTAGLMLLSANALATPAEQGEGNQQREGETASTIIKTSFTVDLNNNKLVQPALPESKQIGIETGIYGVPLGASKAEVLNAFGTPTFEVRVTDNRHLYAFGRYHWLMMQDEKLVAAHFPAQTFTATLVNHLPFDDRFDTRRWHTHTGIKQGAPLTEAENAQLHFRNQHSVLKVITDTYLLDNQQEKETVATGFNLTRTGLQKFAIAAPQVGNNETLDFIHQRLTAPQQTPRTISIDALPEKPVGRSIDFDGKQLYLVGPSTLVEAMGNTVARVHVNPDFISEQPGITNNWQFGDFYFGQPEDHAIAAAGDMAFFFDHTLEYEGEDYTAKLFFEASDGTYKLYSMELIIY